MVSLRRLSREEKLRHFESLWQEYFRDPSQWRDNRSSKIDSALPDFRHVLKDEALWIDGRYNPPWVAEKIRSCESVAAPQTLEPSDTLLCDEVRHFVASLKSCASKKDLSAGIKLHDDILRKGLLERCSDALISMYANCGNLVMAQELLDMYKSSDVISWTAVMSGYAKQGQSLAAFRCFELMKKEGLSPDWVTFTCALKVCGHMRDLDKGKEIHGEISMQELLGKYLVLDTALVDMYAKCGALDKAQEVLDGLPVRNVVCWTALISAYAQEGQSRQALESFKKMQQERIAPDSFTYASILKACGSLGEADIGEQIHQEIRRKGLLKKNVILGSSLVSMYAKCGQLARAQQLLEKLAIRDVVAWNALLAGYTQQRQPEKALDCCERMQREGIRPSAVTYSSILAACGSIGAISMGEKIHEEVANQGLLKNNVILGNALIGMYAKCGALVKAQEVLEQLSCRDVASWNALMTGYCQQGQFVETLNCFKLMEDEAIAPDAMSFSCVLNVCSHLGLVDDGQSYFVIMSKKYGLKPDLGNYTCVIDLFGRAGRLDKAIEVTQSMSSVDLAVCCALLGASRKWKDVDVGRWAFQHAIDLDKGDPAPYVLMANVYAAAGMHGEAENVERMRIENKAEMEGCCWWVDTNGNIHRFFVGDTEHNQITDIQAKLEDIFSRLLEAGNLPSFPADAKMDILCGHSEKLALACALINSPQEESIHIVKNLRICGDCHTLTTLISKLEKRRIMIRDADRWHEFEDGKCSCENYF